MAESKQSKITKLDRVTSSIVYELGEVGVFHYCKLAYLFEYFFIKNFGSRYTKEYFIKLPHGPVIINYKNQISNLYGMEIIDVNLKELKRNRNFDDFNETVLIKSNPKTSACLIPEKMAYALLLQILQKFGSMSVKDLEKFVYETSPIKKYIEAVSMGFKRPTGGYVLKGDCIRMKDYKNSRTKGREIAMKHLQKYPHINFQTQKELIEEMKELNNLRPTT